MFKFVYKSDWITKIFLGFLAFIFILGTAVMFGPGSWNFGLGNYAVKVGDITSTPKEYTLTLASLRYRYGNQLPESQLKRLALDRLVVQDLLAYLAERDGYYVSKEEITDYIRRSFSVNGTFQPELLKNFLETHRLTAAEYEDMVKKELLAAKYKSAVFSTSYADDEVVRSVLLPFALKVKAKIFLLPVEAYAGNQTVSPQEVEGFYKENRERLKQTIPARVVVYEVKGEKRLKEIYETLKEGKHPQTQPVLEVPVDKIGGVKNETLREFAKSVASAKTVMVKRVENGTFLVGVFYPKTEGVPPLSEIKPSVEKLLKTQKALSYLQTHREELVKKVLNGKVEATVFEKELSGYELIKAYGLSPDDLLQILKGKKLFSAVNGNGLVVILVEGYKLDASSLPVENYQLYVRNADYSKKLQQVIDYVIKHHQVKIEVNKNLLNL